MSIQPSTYTGVSLQEKAR